MKDSLRVIFDMDGVLVDNFSWHLLAWETFCNRHKKHISADEFRKQVFGGNNPDHLRYIFGNDISDQQIEEYSLEKESIYRELYTGNISPVKGLSSFLEELRENNIPLAIATSAERTNVDFILEAIGCVGLFDQVVDSTMITERKPNPEVFLKAAMLLKSKPEECIVFEDSLKGIEAGLRARMKVVGVATTHYYAELTEAHKVISDFSDITLKDLRKLVKKPI